MTGLADRASVPMTLFLYLYDQHSGSPYKRTPAGHPLCEERSGLCSYPRPGLGSEERSNEWGPRTCMTLSIIHTILWIARVFGSARSSSWQRGAQAALDSTLSSGCIGPCVKRTVRQVRPPRPPRQAATDRRPPESGNEGPGRRGCGCTATRNTRGPFGSRDRPGPGPPQARLSTSPGLGRHPRF